MKIEWNKVTWYSKLIAVVLFVSTFWIAFCLGYNFGLIQTVNQTPETTNSQTEGNIVLKIGQSKSIGSLKITLVSILGDSRCPADVQCIWAGNVNTKISLSYNGISVTKELSTDSDPINYSGLNISIKSVSPSKDSKVKIDKSEYEVTFHVSK